MENRVIKFRAWHRDKMYNVDTLSINDVGVDGIGSFAHPERNHTINVNSCLSFNTSTVFMQYTGLKDKKGKEAYAGDVCKQVMLDGSERFYKIFNVKGGFAVNVHQDDFHKDVERIVFYDSLGDIQCSSWFENSCEIIGNIHQNPELLLC